MNTPFKEQVSMDFQWKAWCVPGHLPYSNIFHIEFTIMTIKQLSIFIENQSGALLRVLKMLRDNGISIIVSTLGDTDGFGIYRIICNDTEKAFKILREKNISATISNVYGIRLAENKPGAAAEVVEMMNEGGVSIKYLYSFLYAGKGIIVFRPDNNDKAEETIMLKKLDYITEEDLAHQG